MTRINTIDPELNTTVNLLAEWKELTRIPNKIVSGRTKLERILPPEYCIRSDTYKVPGSGHELFFLNKLGWLYEHYLRIISELDNRGYPKECRWPKRLTHNEFPQCYVINYQPTKRDHVRNIQRMYERFELGKKKHVVGHKDNPIEISDFENLRKMWFTRHGIEATTLEEAWNKYVI